MTEAGKLRYPLTLQTKPAPASATYDSHNQETEVWTDAGTYHGEIRPLSGRALELARQLRNDVTHSITTRYFGRVDPRVSRWVYSGRIFNIVDAIDVEERRRESRFTCVEVIGNS